MNSKEYNRNYYQNPINKKRQAMHVKKYLIKLRMDVLNIIGKGKLECVNCGCDDLRVIEINHINGVGNKYRVANIKFLWDVIKGRRPTDDLDLRCRVCNALHYIELKHGKLPFKVHYTKSLDVK